MLDVSPVLFNEESIIVDASTKSIKSDDNLLHYSKDESAFLKNVLNAECFHGTTKRDDIRLEMAKTLIVQMQEEI